MLLIFFLRCYTTATFSSIYDVFLYQFFLSEYPPKTCLLSLFTCQNFEQLHLQGFVISQDPYQQWQICIPGDIRWSSDTDQGPEGRQSDPGDTTSARGFPIHPSACRKGHPGCTKRWVRSLLSFLKHQTHLVAYYSTTVPEICYMRTPCVQDGNKTLRKI